MITIKLTDKQAEVLLNHLPYIRNGLDETAKQLKKQPYSDDNRRKILRYSDDVNQLNLIIGKINEERQE